MTGDRAALAAIIHAARVRTGDGCPACQGRASSTTFSPPGGSHDPHELECAACGATTRARMADRGDDNCGHTERHNGQCLTCGDQDNATDGGPIRLPVEGLLRDLDAAITGRDTALAELTDLRARVEAMIRLLFPDEMTPTARRQLRAALAAVDAVDAGDASGAEHEAALGPQSTKADSRAAEPAGSGLASPAPFAYDRDRQAGPTPDPAPWLSIAEMDTAERFRTRPVADSAMTPRSLADRLGGSPAHEPDDPPPGCSVRTPAHDSPNCHRCQASAR